ncbi:hypothetical protein BT69DRAFT_37747 [Atractiella rhizophila]|nr:hypothetical protein BT69DRAFT_37747 [Atractiella rhizophila]
MQLQRPPPMPASMTQAYLSPTNAYYGAPFLSGYDPRLYPAPGYPYLPPSTSPSAAAAAAAATSLGYLTGLYGTSYNHHHAGQPIPGFPALAGGVGIGMGAGSGGGSNIDFALLNGWAENQKSMERNALSTSSSSGTGNGDHRDTPLSRLLTTSPGLEEPSGSGSGGRKRKAPDRDGDHGSEVSHKKERVGGTTHADDLEALLFGASVHERRENEQRQHLSSIFNSHHPQNEGAKEQGFDFASALTGGLLTGRSDFNWPSNHSQTQDGDK